MTVKRTGRLELRCHHSEHSNLRSEAGPPSQIGSAVLSDVAQLNPPPNKMLDEDAKWIAVSLRIMGDALDPTKLESLLGLKPDILGIMGQRRIGKLGRKYAPFEMNLWSCQEGSGPGIGIDQQVQSLFARHGDRVSEHQLLSTTEEWMSSCS